MIDQTGEINVKVICKQMRVKAYRQIKSPDKMFSKTRRNSNINIKHLKNNVGKQE